MDENLELESVTTNGSFRRRARKASETMEIDRSRQWRFCILSCLAGIVIAAVLVFALSLSGSTKLFCNGSAECNERIGALERKVESIKSEMLSSKTNLIASSLPRFRQEESNGTTILNENNYEVIRQLVEDLKSKTNFEINTIKTQLVTKDEEVRELKTKLLTKDSEVREIKSKLSSLETRNSAINSELADLKIKVLFRMSSQPNIALVTPPPIREAQLNDLKSKVEEIRDKVFDNKLAITETKNEMLGIKSNTDLSLARLKVLEDIVSGLGNVSEKMKSEMNGTDQILLQDLLAEIHQLRDQTSQNLESLNQKFVTFSTTAANSSSYEVDELAKLQQDVKKLSVMSKLSSKAPKSCQDLLDFGVTESGSYMIDPDGSGTGAPPFEVFCNFVNGLGTTEISHQALGSVPIPEHCNSHDCFNLNLTYSISLEQIKSVIKISKSCRQFIKFDCVLAPLDQVAAWISSDGRKQIYFDGDDSSVHACKCYRDEEDSCYRPPWYKRCNCDVHGVTNWTSDEGYLTDMDLLPVMGFTYGFLLSAGHANVTIGKLECNGQKVVEEGSCNAIKMEGATRSGYYILNSQTEPESLRVAHCNMNLPFFDNQMEKDIGKLTLGKPARFVVEQNVNIRWPAGANVTFAEVLHSNGWDIDISTGVFSPMRNGTYLFVLSGTALKTDSKISMITKSGKTEDIFESATGIFNLIEEPYQINIYNRYQSNYLETFYKYAKGAETVTELNRGISRLIVKQLKAGDEVWLKTVTDAAISTGSKKPFRFMGFELI